MSQTEDQLDSGGGITDMVFDADHQERRSWRFCNSRLPRSEVVYFTQINNNFSYNCVSRQVGFFQSRL